MVHAACVIPCLNSFSPQLWLVQATDRLHPVAPAPQEDPTVKAMHERAEQFDPRAEFVFSYLQVRLEVVQRLPQSATITAAPLPRCHLQATLALLLSPRLEQILC